MTRSPGGPGPAGAGLHRPPDAALRLAAFNNAEITVVTELLGACLDIAEWVDEVAAGRPYADLDSLLAHASAASGRITWDQVAGALARHPRIGEKTAAAAGTEAESAWSAGEQAGVQDAQADALADGNRAYEDRFGFLFLISAAGLDGEQIVANLYRRLENDLATEKPVVIGELRKIADVRLAKAVRR